jgi:hypothetical protein
MSDEQLMVLRHIREAAKLDTKKSSITWPLLGQKRRCRRMFLRIFETRKPCVSST